MTDKINSNEIRERVYRVLGVTEFAVDMMNNSAELRFTEGNRLFVLPYQSMLSDSDLAQAYRAALKKQLEAEMQYHRQMADVIERHLSEWQDI